MSGTRTRIWVKVLTVYRYRTSGKLIAAGLYDGYVLPVNSDLTFADKAPHKVRRGTLLDPTPYRIEVETGSQHGQTTYRIVRAWNEDDRPPKSADPAAPLEARIEISPSEGFSDSEKRYIGRSEGHPIGLF